jgi:hypothetical protein
MKMSWTVQEIQTQLDGSSAFINNCFTDESAAQADFHTKCAAASLSSVPIHVVNMNDYSGYQIKHECFNHANVVPGG